MGTAGTAYPDPVEKKEKAIQAIIGSRMFVGVNLASTPSFTTKIAAMTFFFRSDSWLRMKMKGGAFDPTSALVRSGDPERNEFNVRQFSLADIEIMAVNARLRCEISHDHFLATMGVLRAIGVGYGVIE